LFEHLLHPLFQRRESFSLLSDNVLIKVLQSLIDSRFNGCFILFGHFDAFSHLLAKLLKALIIACLKSSPDTFTAKL